MEAKYIVRWRPFLGAMTPILVAILAVITPFAFNGVSQAQVHESNIVINEIMYNPATTVDYNGEWFEVVNTSGSTIDINGWCIRDVDQGETHTIDNGGPLNVPANGYLVLGRNGNTSENGGISLDYVYGTAITLRNTTDEIILENSSCGTGGTEQDRVEYGTTSPWPSSQNGHSIIFCFGSSSNNDGSKWQRSDTNTYGDGTNYGTPKTQNDCHDPTAAVLVSFGAKSSRNVSRLWAIAALAGLVAVGASIVALQRRRVA